LIKPIALNHSIKTVDKIKINLNFDSCYTTINKEENNTSRAEANLNQTGFAVCKANVFGNSCVEDGTHGNWCGPSIRA